MRAALGVGWAVLFATTAAAQPAPPSGSTPQVPAVVQQCVGCHGAQGQGLPAAGFPRIAAQSEYYLAKQLHDYASGARRNPVMEPIARALSEEDIVAVATYYSRVEARPTPAPKGPERGRVLATVGDAASGVQACVNCHGPGGIGEPPAIPYLAGLDAAYLATAINAWKAGIRRNDAGGQMLTVAQALTAEDIAAVSAYYAGLQPPSPPPSGAVQVRPRLPDAAAQGRGSNAAGAGSATPGGEGEGSGSTEAEDAE